MKRISLSLVIILFCLVTNAIALPPAGIDTTTADANLHSAIVYFGYGAELSHDAIVKADLNTKFIVINQLSTNIDINSLQVSCPEFVAILSQQYNLFYPPPPLPVKSKEVERLEDSIELIQKEINHENNIIAIEQEILNKTGLLIESTVNNSGTKGITSAELMKLIDFYNARIDKAKTNIFNDQQQNKLLAERIIALQTRLDQANKNAAIAEAKPYGQLILQVICSKAGEIPVSLSYYTNNAGWTPMYDIRVNSKTNKVKLVYKASLTQTTGIDWKKTKLTLSTGTPSSAIVAPVLTPWFLQLYVPEIYGYLNGRVSGVNVNGSRNMLQSMKDDKSLSEVVVTGYAVAGSSDYYIRQQADTINQSTLEQFTKLNEGQLNTNFEIDLPYDIDADGKLHSVTIRDQEIDCILKNYGIPRIDKEAWLLAEVADWQNLDLLPGDANIIMDETYIGKSVIDPNSIADTLNLSLGKDKRLAIKRSVVKELSSLKTSGPNTRQSFTYEIILKNNKLTECNVLLKDQYPLSTIKEVEVKLEDGGDAVVNEETGVLTWKVNLKPGETKKFRFSYSVKYPKDKKIVNLK